MGWIVRCVCGKKTKVKNIVKLFEHTDNEGWFRCECGKPGYIKKEFRLQEKGQWWKPFLRGVIPLHDPDSNKTYKPFVFLVSQEPDGNVKDIWFCYYKNLKQEGGRLKLGYGPSGPPVLAKNRVLHLIKRLIEIRVVAPEDVKQVLGLSS
jgi:hypothetical protein